nr:DUF222 domain-containing protein [Rhodococcus sp. EPR-157]
MPGRGRRPLQYWPSLARPEAGSPSLRSLSNGVRFPNGMARMSAVLGAVDAAELTAILDRECERVCMLDPRTLDTRRSDAFAARLRGGHLTCNCGFPDCQPPSDTEDTEDTDKGQDEPNDSSDRSATPTPSNDTEPNDTDSTITESATGTGRPSDSTTDAGNCNCGRPFAPPDTSATKPLIHITANLETILGLQSRAAYLHGYGHLDPTTLRTLAQDATWQVIFTVGRKYLDALTTSARCSCGQPRSSPTTYYTSPTHTEATTSAHPNCEGSVGRNDCRAQNSDVASHA